MTTPHPDEIPEGMFDDTDYLEEIFEDYFYGEDAPLESPSWPFWPDRKFNEYGTMVVEYGERRPSFDEYILSKGVLLKGKPRRHNRES